MYLWRGEVYVLGLGVVVSSLLSLVVLVIAAAVVVRVDFGGCPAWATSAAVAKSRPSYH